MVNDVNSDLSKDPSNEISKEVSNEQRGSSLASVKTHESSTSGMVKPYLANDEDEVPEKLQRKDTRASVLSQSSRLSRLSRTSQVSNASRYSEKVIYGDLDESTVALEREATRTSVASRAGQTSLYRQDSHITAEGDDVIATGEEYEEEDPELVTWEGPDDPGNPRNWRSGRKLKMTFLAGFQTLIPTVASSILAPTVPNILERYHNSNLTVGSLLVSIMVLLWGFSVIFWAPLSEMYGRRNIILISAFGDLVFNITCAVSPTTATMLVFRALAGTFNSAPIAMGGGILADIYEDKERQWPLAFWSLAPACGPGIAPVIGGFIAQYTTWKWAFWSVVILQGAALAILMLFFEESYPQEILKRRKKRLIKETGNKNLHTVWDLTAQPFLTEIRLACIRPILFLFLNPVVLLLATYLAYTYGFMYLILTNFPSLWKQKYHYSSGISGLMYIGYATGMMAGVAIWPLLINWWYDRQFQAGKGKLEDRLFMLPIATFLLAGGMFWYGWSAQAHMMWLMPVVGIGIFSFSIFCVFQSVQSYIVSLNARLAGSAIASCVMGRCILGGTFPLFGRPMYDKLGYGWASTVVALLAIVLGVPWPIGIYIYGPRLRAWADKNIHIA